MTAVLLAALIHPAEPPAAEPVGVILPWLSLERARGAGRGRPGR
jgi:hypothetical protein